jgi:hypothetical protein
MEGTKALKDVIEAQAGVEERDRKKQKERRKKWKELKVEIEGRD